MRPCDPRAGLAKRPCTRQLLSENLGEETLKIDLRTDGDARLVDAKGETIFGEETMAVRSTGKGGFHSCRCQ